MRHAIRTPVRVLVTTLSIATIVIGFSQGGNPLVHPVSGAGSSMIFVGVVVLFGYWSLAWCNWYSTLTVSQLGTSNTPTPHPTDASGPLGHEDGDETADNVAFDRSVPVRTR
jgi:hypothetical protein